MSTRNGKVIFHSSCLNCGFHAQVLAGHYLEGYALEEMIIRILIEELKYKPETAKQTCQDLLEIKDTEIQQALSAWVQTREMTPVSAEGYDAVSLSRRMKYPSSLLAIDMLRKEPIKAKQALKGFR